MILRITNRLRIPAAMAALAVTSACGEIRQPQAPAPAPSTCTPQPGSHPLENSICHLGDLERQLDAQAVADAQPRRTVADVVADAVTPFTLAGLILVAAAVIYGSTGRTRAPEHRHPEGPAAAAHSHRNSARTATAAAIALVGLSPLVWHFAGLWAAALTLPLMACLLAARDLRAGAAGAEIADSQWLQDAATAERAGQLVPPEPVMDLAQLRELAATGGWSCPEGSAAAVMLDASGRPGPLVQVWNRVSQARGLGFATIVEHRVGETGDVTVFWQLDSGRTAANLAPARDLLIHELRVRAMVGGFETEFQTGRVFATFTTGASAPAPEQQATPPVDPMSDFRW